MSFPEITSKENPLVRRIRLVASGSRRAPRDLVLAEGLRVLEEAAEHLIDAVVISEGFGKRDREQLLISRLRSKSVKIYRADRKLMKSLSEVLSPQGALALVRVPRLNLADIRLGPNPVVLCACAIQDPGNLGTLLRAAAAAAAALVCTTTSTVSSRNPKCIRASAGTYFRIPVVEELAPKDILEYCGRHGLQPVRADARTGEPYSKMDLTKPTAILLGNESQGLPGIEWSGIRAVRIPMAPGVESLNVASAGAILLFEALRQRDL